jgi:NADH-quinone oxidoreductase subunit J
MPGSPVVFFILAAVAVGTALGMVLSRNAIYSALFLALNFSAVAMLYLVLGAPFIALSQITVYAGSIMVLFLFVIMLLGAENLPQGEELRWQPLLAIPLLVILAGDFALNLVRNNSQLAGAASLPEGFGSPAAIGDLLFTQYALPFEVTGVILLTATLGAIMLAKADRLSVGERIRRDHSAARNVDSVTGREIAPGAEHAVREDYVQPVASPVEDQPEPESPAKSR